MRGPRAIEFSVVFYRIASPDLEVRVDDGETVLLNWTASASNKPVAEPTSKNVPQTMSGTTLSHVERNQVVEGWPKWDASAHCKS